VNFFGFFLIQLQEFVSSAVADGAIVPDRYLGILMRRIKFLPAEPMFWPWESM